MISGHIMQREVLVVFVPEIFWSLTCLCRLYTYLRCTVQCISAFSCDNTLCPGKQKNRFKHQMKFTLCRTGLSPRQQIFLTFEVQGCGIPLSVTGSRHGSFIKTNPSLETVLCSFQTICQTLDKAPKKWWQHGQDTDDAAEDEPTNNNNDSSSDEEMITLNVTAPREDDSDDDDDDNDDERASDEKRNWLRQIDIDSDEDD